MYVIDNSNDYKIYITSKIIYKSCEQEMIDSD